MREVPLTVPRSRRGDRLQTMETDSFGVETFATLSIFPCSTRFRDLGAQMPPFLWS